VSQRTDARASEPDCGGIAESARLQFSALSLPGHRPLRAGRRLCARPCRSQSAGRSCAGDWVCAWVRADHDAGIYCFIANIYFYDIETPLKQYVAAQKNIVRHCSEIHETVMRGRAHGEAKSKAHSEGGPSGSPNNKLPLRPIEHFRARRGTARGNTIS